VLVFTSAELKQEIEVTGLPRVTLHVSADAVDTDITAKLVDVHPDGSASICPKASCVRAIAKGRSGNSSRTVTSIGKPA
jgi:predicted acyl esterase